MPVQWYYRTGKLGEMWLDHELIEYTFCSAIGSKTRHTNRLHQTATVHDSTSHLPNGCDGRVAGQHGDDGFNRFFLEVIAAEAVQNMRT